MKRPLLPREHLEHWLERRRNMLAHGVHPTGNRDIDSTRMMHALGMKKRGIGEIMENYEQHDWRGTIEALAAKPRER